MKSWRTVGVSMPIQIYKLLELKSEETGLTKHRLMVEAIADFVLTEKPLTADISSD